MAEKGLAVVPMVPIVVTMMGLEVVVLDDMAFDFLLGAVNLSKLDFTRGLEPGARVGSLIGLETSLTESDTIGGTVEETPTASSVVEDTEGLGVVVLLKKSDPNFLGAFLPSFFL